MATGAINWSAIAADPRFRVMHRRKTRFLAGLVLLSVGYFFLLPLGATFYPELYRIRVFGAINIGLLFALSEFLMAGLVAALYLWRANREFDRLAGALNAEIAARHAQEAVL